MIGFTQYLNRTGGLLPGGGSDTVHYSVRSGVTVRDFFAAEALKGLLSFSPAECDEQLSSKEAAAEAYKYADAMLIERQKVLEESSPLPHLEETETGATATTATEQAEPDRTESVKIIIRDSPRNDAWYLTEKDCPTDLFFRLPCKRTSITGDGTRLMVKAYDNLEGTVKALLQAIEDLKYNPKAQTPEDFS